MKRLFLALTCLALVATLFAGCGKKKVEDGASKIESTVSDVASGIQSDISDIGSTIMPTSSNIR